MNRSPEAGFTLLETIVALIVFSLVAAGLQLCLSGGWRIVRIVNAEQTALELARSEIAALGHETPLAAGSSQHETADGFSIVREIRPQDGDTGKGSIDETVAGYWVRVAVQWRETPFRSPRQVALETLKIGRRE